jgi:hypothetical protein
VGEDARAYIGDSWSNPLQLMERALVHHVSGIQRRSRFKEYDPAFLIRYRTMFDSARDHNELAFLYPHLTVAKLHPEAAFGNQKHFIFMLVMMPNELAGKFAELHHLAV